jgi:hypothetical protein
MRSIGVEFRRRLLIIAALVGCGFVASTALAADCLSLAGSWRFRRDDENVGVGQRWFAASLPGAPDSPGTIRLPGTTDQAKAGLPNLKKPTLDGLYRPNVYTGAAWYQRDVEIPAAWRGKHLSLLLERVRWVSQAWLDGRPIGDPQDSLIAPHVYDLGIAVAPGRHVLTLRVDNSLKVNLGVFVSALFGGTETDMNGIVGRLELRATDLLAIDDLQVYPDVAHKLVGLRVRLNNATGKPSKGTLHAEARSTDDQTVAEQNSEIVWDENHGSAEVTLSLHGDFKLWDEFTPNLHRVTVTVQGSGYSDSRTVAFGMRQLGTRGTQLTMNGRPIFLRGTLECAVFPITGYPPTDVAWWQRVCRIIKSYGLNHLRFHSWCPPDAAFAAADIEGIMIQAEGPQANVPAGQDPLRDAFMERELLRMVRTYGNHPSFCLMTLGNEYGGKEEVLTHWVEMLTKEDPRHLYSSASNNGQVTANRQFTVSPVRGIRGPDTVHDFADRIAKQDRPLISHEVGQWMFFPNFDEMKKYTGVLEPRNFQIIHDDLQAKGLLDLAPQFAETWGKQAVLLYKEEIEVLLRTPGHAGFQLLDLHDYPSQGTALIGPLDPFWDSKGFVTPDQHRRYCGATVPLLRMKKRTFTAGEPFEATADVAHFRPQDIVRAEPQWSIRDQQGREIAAGALATLSLPTGKLTPLGAIQTSLSKAPAPCKLTVTVSLKDTPYNNDWEIWVYPDAASPPMPAGVVVCRQWDDAHRALAEGKTVAFFPQKFKFAQALPGRFLPVFWSPVWFPAQKPNTMGILCDPANPALAQFPTENYSNWQWWDLLQDSCSVILDETPADYRPTVQVMDNFARNHKLGNLFEARVGPGRLLACTINMVDNLENRPAARQLLSSLTTYLASEKFHPSHELTLATLDKLFAPPVFANTLAKLGAKVVHVDSEDRAHSHLAAMAMDGDPETFWHTRWKPDDPLPHEIVIDIGQEVVLNGVKYLPRQDMANGRIAEAEIYCSSDPAHWGPPIAKAKWRNSADAQSLKFTRSVKARYLKLVATREQRGQPFIAIAELDILSQ